MIAARPPLYIVLALTGDGVDDLLMMLLEPLFDALFEFLLAGICDLVLRAVRAVFKTEGLPNAWLALSVTYCWDY